MGPKLYEVPAEHYFRLHHSRPRFKTDVESVLLFVAESISNLGEKKKHEFSRALNSILRTYPGNATKTEKTINNWRTEIAGLFSMVRTEDGRSQPTRASLSLAKTGDLVGFFRAFMLTFQYPGAHVKPQTVAEMIAHGVKFHPGRFIIRLLQHGTAQSGKQFAVSPAEIAHMVFNDLRVTALEERSPADVFFEIAANRRAGVKYDERGDVVRYAGDVLDYLVLAQLLEHRPVNNRYHLRSQGALVADALAMNAPIFEGYSNLYGFSVKASDVVGEAAEWSDFVNADYPFLDGLDLVGEVISDGLAAEHSPRYAAIAEQLRQLDPSSTKEIGRLGEAIAILHEHNRLVSCGRGDLAKKVKKMPDHLGVGYDVLSFECQSSGVFFNRRQVEVKTTRSHSASLKWFFKLTPPEWSAAESSGTDYFVYRIFITEGSVKLFVIQDVYGKYVNKIIRMSPRDGAEVSFTEDAGEWVELLLEEIPI